MSEGGHWGQTCLWTSSDFSSLFGPNSGRPRSSPLKFPFELSDASENCTRWLTSSWSSVVFPLAPKRLRAPFRAPSVVRDHPTPPFFDSRVLSSPTGTSRKTSFCQENISPPRRVPSVCDALVLLALPTRWTQLSGRIVARH